MTTPGSDNRHFCSLHRSDPVRSPALAETAVTNEVLNANRGEEIHGRTD